jgi:hypothetical protein
MKTKLRLVHLPLLISWIAFYIINTDATLADEDIAVSNYKYALIRGLNKVTGKSLVLKVPVSEDLYYFEKLGFFVRSCQKNPEENPMESKAILEVWHKNSTGDTERVFFGWLFSLNSSVSTVEHPVYDIALVECIN